MFKISSNQRSSIITFSFIQNKMENMYIAILSVKLQFKKIILNDM